jgi:hypothetical protein
MGAGFHGGFGNTKGSRNTQYKGDSKLYRSIGQNILSVSKRFPLTNGRFGESSPSTGNKTRNIVSSNPLKTSQQFYDKLSYGGKEIIRNNGALHITKMSDGTIISRREKSSSDGTPVVEINISYSSHTSGIKEQKIHFIKG